MGRAELGAGQTRPNRSRHHPLARDDRSDRAEIAPVDISLSRAVASTFAAIMGVVPATSTDHHWLPAFHVPGSTLGTTSSPGRSSDVQVSVPLPRSLGHASRVELAPRFGSPFDSN